MTEEHVRQAFAKCVGVDHEEDSEHIAEVVSERLGVSISPHEAYTFWRWYSSETCAAGWMCMPEEDGEIISAFNFFVSQFVPEADNNDDIHVGHHSV